MEVFIDEVLYKEEDIATGYISYRIPRVLHFQQQLHLQGRFYNYCTYHLLETEYPWHNCPFEIDR